MKHALSNTQTIELKSEKEDTQDKTDIDKTKE